MLREVQPLRLGSNPSTRATFYKQNKNGNTGNNCIIYFFAAMQ
jgi:hypothetical protein